MGGGRWLGRQVHGEGRALPGRAFHRHGAPVQGGDLLDDGKPETEAADLASVPLGGEIRIEDPGAVLGVDADPFVDDLQLDPAPVSGHRPDLHPFSETRGVDGVVHEVDEHPFEENRIAAEHGSARDIRGEVDPEFFRAFGGGVAHSGEQLREIDWFRAGTQVFGEEQSLAHIVGDGADGAARGGVNLGGLGAGWEAILGVHEEGIHRSDEVLEVMRQRAGHHRQMFEAVLQGDLVGQSRAREDTVDQFGDVLEPCDLRVGDRPVVRAGTEGDDDGRVGTAAGDRHRRAQAVGGENRGKVLVRGGGPAALQAFRRDPTEREQRAEAGPVPRDPDSLAREMTALQGKDRGLFDPEVARDGRLALAS